ncbi:MAG: sulfite exporter TauE/SafE family protein [Chitinophagales bacterium]
MKNNKLANMNAETILILILIGLAAGTLSGLVGVGGGVIIIPALVFFLGFSQFAAQGTSLGLLLLPVGILAVINYYNKGYIDLKVVGIMCIAFVLGGWMGSKLALSLSQEVVKRIFAVVLFYTAFKMLGWDVLFFKWVKELFN